MNVLTNNLNQSLYSKHLDINTVTRTNRERKINSIEDSGLCSCTIVSHITSGISSFLNSLSRLYHGEKPLNSKTVELKSCNVKDFASVTRVALDVGSGGIRITMADVDPIKRQITKIHYSEEHLVPFKRDMQVSGQFRFSEKIQQVAIDTLTKLKANMSRFAALEWKGIATSASRQSENAKMMFEKIRQDLGIDVSIITQTEEGRIGFLTAVAVSKLDEDEIVAFDSGAGSFQLTTKINGKLEVVESETAYGAAFSTLIKDIRKQRIEAKSQANPVNRTEAKLLVKLLQKQMPKISSEFAAKLNKKSTTIVGIGKQTYIVGIGAVAVGKNTFTKEELWQAIEAHCDLTNEQLSKFTYPHPAVVGMILLYTIMNALNIEKLTYAPANGSCEGLLVDPNYYNM